MNHSVADELAIRHLVSAYADAVNRRDGSLWASTWADDGVWDLMGNAIEGKDAVVAMWNNAMGGFEFVVQLVYQGTIQIDGDTATGRWYLAEHLRPRGSAGGMFNIRTSTGRLMALGSLRGVPTTCCITMKVRET